MAGRIQKVPDGLLNLLGLKTTGRNVTEYPDTLQPTLDHTDFYTLPTLEIRNQVDNIQVAGSAMLIQVPPNEIWRTFGFGVHVDRNPADVAVPAQFGLSLRVDGSSMVDAWPFFNTTIDQSDTTLVSDGLQFSPPLWLPPGAVFLFTNKTDWPTAAATIFASLLISVVPN